MRNLAKEFSNAYIAVIFACCREIFIPSRHGNCVGANTKEEAELQFDKIKADEEEAKINEISKDETIEFLRKQVADFVA